MSSMQMSELKKKIEILADPMRVEYPVAKTFIQYPALRNPSLEAFFKEREVLSCPASRMGSLDEFDEATNCTSDTFSTTSNEVQYTVKNTFVDCPAWEPLRPFSLEGFFQEREFQSCPPTRMHSLDDTSEDSDVEKKTFEVEHQALRSFSLEECLRDIEAKYQDLALEDQTSTKANTEEQTAPPTPEILSESEEDTKPSVISLTSSLGLWSVGSAEHSSGNCKPCAWQWKDASGCQNGTNCRFCHLCPPGEVKRRKKEKMFMRKMLKDLQQQPAIGCNGIF